MRPVEEVVAVTRIEEDGGAGGNAEEDEIGHRADDRGSQGKIGGSEARAVDAEVGDVGRAGRAEGHLDALAGAGGALGEGAVGALSDVAQVVEEDPVWGVVGLVLVLG